MPLANGTRLGPYELLDAIGAGGMGEVYRALDPRLQRDVAVKVLPASFSSDPQRLRRFEQEARAAAGLNHPNILAVFDVGTHDGSPYIVSELLEGETLRNKLKLGPLSLRKAVDYALQIARGLAAAHEKGIVHRDLKPENIFITKDGRVKLLDFGLAKLTQPADRAQEATHTLQSDEGSVVGTVGYMSPEQVRGKVADGRSDLFALGAVLYEMLTGRRAFRGDTAADTITAILTKDPPELTQENPQVSPALDRIVRHCLEKAPEERFQSSSDVAFDLELLSSISSTMTLPAAQPVVKRKLIAFLIAGAAAALILLGAGMVVGRKTVSQPSTPSYRQLTFRRGTVRTGKFAPGGQIVYSAAWEGNEPELFTTGTEARGSASTGIRNADIESISRSGELLLVSNRRFVFAFAQPGTLARSPLSESAPRPILEDVQDADWAPDGNNIAAARFVDQRFRLEFPIGKVLYVTDGWISFPRVSPKGDMVAFLDHPLFGDDRGSVAVVDLEGHKRILSPEFASTQALAWRPEGDELWFSAATTGSAADLYGVDLHGKLRTIVRVPGGLRLLDVGRNGSVIMAQGHVRRVAMVAGRGQTGERDLAVADWTLNRDITNDGSAVVLEEEAEGTTNGVYSVYLRKVDGSPPVRLGEGSAGPLSPDGQWALAATLSMPSQLMLLPTGAGEPHPLTHDSMAHLEACWLPDSKHVVFVARVPGGKSRLYLQAIDGSPATQLGSEGTMTGPVLCSPDGKFAAVKDPKQTWLIPLDGGQPRQIPGTGPEDFGVQWSQDGRALFMAGPLSMHARLFRVDIASGKREVVKQFTPADTAGVQGIGPIQVTPDLRYYSYGFGRYLTDMYSVEGLK